jgi:hypothetical protein
MTKTTIDDILRRAVAIIRRMPELEDGQLMTLLVAEGISAPLASSCVAFVPLVYGRLLLANKGIHFSDSFQRQLPGGGHSTPMFFTSEPVWNAAESFARAEVEGGLSPKDLLAVALRSAEVHAVDALLEQGSKLQDIHLTSPLLSQLTS